MSPPMPVDPGSVMLSAAAVGKRISLVYHHYNISKSITVHTNGDSCILNKEGSQYLLLGIVIERATYRCISALAQNSMTCCRSQRLGARDNAIPAVHSTPSTGKGNEVCVRLGVDCFRVERHVEMDAG